MTRRLLRVLAAASVSLLALAAVSPFRSPARATVCDISALRTGTILRGTYTCSQGPTDLSLVVSRVAGTSIEAIFDFVWREGNVRGRFEMSGVVDTQSCRLHLHQRRWIAQPPGWVMVDLDGTLAKSGALYRGNVAAVGSACTTFSVSRR